MNDYNSEQQSIIRREEMEVTKVKDLPTTTTGAIQALYRVDPPYEVRNWDDEVEQTTEYVVVSAVNAMFSGPETYIFPADPSGEITGWSELPGSYRGGYDHGEAIRGLIESVKYE